MVTHIVLFKLKEFENENIKIAMRDKIAEALRGLKEKVPVLEFLEVGLHHTLSASTFDISLTTRFKSFDDLEAYQVHPDHQVVVALVRANVSERAVVDYES